MFTVDCSDVVVELVEDKEGVRQTIAVLRIYCPPPRDVAPSDASMALGKAHFKSWGVDIVVVSEEFEGPISVVGEDMLDYIKLEFDVLDGQSSLPKPIMFDRV